jgi:flagellar motor switch protein FliG
MAEITNPSASELAKASLHAPPMTQEEILATMSGTEKSAILIVTLGLDCATEIFKNLRQEEVEKVVLEVARLGTVPIDKRDAVIGEAYQRAVALKYVREGGIEYAKEILERTLGTDQADDITLRLFSGLTDDTPLQVVKKFEPEQLLHLVQHEHPQTLALIILYMEPEAAGQLLSQLTPELKADIAMRIALLQKAAPDVLEQLDDLLGRRLLVAGKDNAREGGVQSLANVMGYVDRQTEKDILDGLSARDPELAEEVKSLLFVFEDIVKLDDRAIQRILKEVNGKDLSLALKTANEDLMAKIYKNMSQRSAETLKDDIQVLGPVRVADVGKAQTAIVEVIRTLEESGEIMINRGAKDDQLV